ncbi:unnamed protein product [Orchesella dallaii]|uniref:Uncharacterized protein n=1 Tax=Orchesella dallaii TaxID=48710 RepID=A0ABP1PRU1_9HEXA
MLSSPRIIQLVALSDMILAISLSSYLGLLIRHGAELIPGPYSVTEKITRLVVYSSLLYFFLSIQLFMAFQLLKSTKLVLEEPMKSMKKIGIWLEWSFVYVLFIGLHGATALLLMKPTQRKHILLALTSIQVLFRIIGILIITKYQFIFPQRSLIKV